jgi:predicted  nucleic acid-binding Zn-ribbon protein
VHEDLERLATVDRLDRSIDKARRAIAGGRRAIEEGKGRLQQATDSQQAAQQAVDDTRAEERALHRRLEAARGHRANALRLLETGQGDPEGAQRQLDKSSALIDELETEMLELMERQDAQQAALAAATEVRAAEQSKVDELVEAQPALEAEQRASIAADQEEREPVWAQLPADLQQRYDDFRAKRMWAVSRLRDGACHACNTVVRQQHVADLKRGILKPCMGCHRFLVVPDA